MKQIALVRGKVRASASQSHPAPSRLHQFFERTCDLTPDAPALICDSVCLSYGDLDARANQLAHFLRRRGIQAGDRVGFVLERSVDTYATLLAILKCGGTFVPLDPAFPPDRIAFISQDADLRLLISTSSLAAGREATCPVIFLDRVQVDLAREATCRLPHEGEDDPSALAYIIYTSGTTGRPKGVAIEQDSICNFVRVCTPLYDVQRSDRVYQGMTLAFDFSIEEVWPTFAVGATLVAGPTDHRRFGSGLNDFLIEQGITVFYCVPTLLATLEHDVPTLRTLLVGGEACPADLVRRWARPGRRILNTYGPTETTVTATWAELCPDRPVTIGRPLPTYLVRLLDEQRQPVPEGEVGEICIGGPGVAVGYVNLPEVTADRFIADPLNPEARLYRSGDLGRLTLNGEIEYLGRIDTQVKIRGHRIELGEIEAVLHEDQDVLAAVATTVPGEGTVELAAYIVARPGADLAIVRPRLFAELARRLPACMVPAYLEALTTLPMLPSNKVDRSRLPRPTGPRRLAACAVEGDAPATALEQDIAAIWARVLGHPVDSVEADFFLDYGGHSLFAARVVSELRTHSELAGLGLADLYAHPTIRGLAGLARPVSLEPPPAHKPTSTAPRKSPFLATVIQTTWILCELVVSGAFLYLLAFHLVPDLTATIGLSAFLLATPLLYAVGVCGYVVASVGFAVLLKKVLIGRYRPLRAPVWGGFYVRNWIVQQAVRLIPWMLLEGTIFQSVVLRALGARIGKRVHIHRGVHLIHGGWDLLEIGDDVTISRDASLRLVDLDNGEIVLGSVTIGSGCTLEVRTGMGPDTRMEPDSYLTAHAYLTSGTTVPRGERWTGAPASRAGEAPPAPSLPEGSQELSPTAHGVVLFSARLLLGALGILPLALLAVVFTWIYGIDAAVAAEWLLHPSLDAGQFLLSAVLVVLIIPLLLVSRCLSVRALGRIPEGVIPRWSYAYIRVQLKSDILDWANEWLDGTLFWPLWLRGAGMKIGPWSEISRIYDVIPELTEVGTFSFFAGGIFLGPPHVHRGTVTLARVKLGDRVFLGNYAVVPAGQVIPDGVLIGVCTIADDTIMKPGTAWFGQPPFELPRREIITADVCMTFKPTALRFTNRVFWECLRFALPLAPALLILAWLTLLVMAEGAVSFPVLVLAIVPALDLAFLASLCLLAVGLKWLLLGRVQPGTHPLWSCWSCRWDFNYTALHALALDTVALLEGTIWLNAYLRALGVKVGRNVVLYDVSSFCTDPDMLEIADEATVNCLYQAHTFEDRVLKIDRIAIGKRASLGSGALLLYGTTIGEETQVVAHSVVMKGETLEAGHTYAGCPTRLVPDAR
jgi:non-ribosomal peptide synthetase-like protein